MKYLRKYNEDIDTDISTNKYSDLKSEISGLIENSLKISNNKTSDEFISAFLKNPEETQIEGLINNSDIYDFYLKWRDDIDVILSDIRFYDETPSELKVFSLYDYIVSGTKKAVAEIVSMLSE
jgi:pectate lyase